MVLRALRARRRALEHRRPERRVVQRAVHDQLVSVAGLLGRPVRERTGAEVGRVADVVIRCDGAVYPAVCGLVVRVGRRSAFIAADAVAAVEPTVVTLRTARVDLRDFVPRDGEVALARHVIDHQLVDVDGVRVVRASDLYLANIGDVVRLVGVGMHTLLRRLGPRRLRTIPTPSKVIDWAAIQPLTAPGAPMRLTAGHAGLRRLRPAEVADLLEDLGRDQRLELLGALDHGLAAEALEELDDDDRELLLHELPPARVAALLTDMAPDEAADALRDLEPDDRAAIIAELPSETAAELGMLAAFDEDSAGAAMTTVLVRATPDRQVADVVAELHALVDDRLDIDGVLIVDDAGRLIDDVSLLELLVAAPRATLGALVADPLPVTVRLDDPIAVVVQRFVDKRGTSIVVVDDGDHPVGRILADDVVDVLLKDNRLRHVVRGLS